MFLCSFTLGELQQLFCKLFVEWEMEREIKINLLKKATLVRWCGGK